MILNREPVAILNAVRLAVLALIAFGLDVTEVQLVTVMTFLEAALTLVTRDRVTPNQTAEEHVETALHLASVGNLPPPDDIPTTGSDSGQSYLPMLLVFVIGFILGALSHNAGLVG